MLPYAVVFFFLCPSWFGLSCIPFNLISFFAYKKKKKKKTYGELYSIKGQKGGQSTNESVSPPSRRSGHMSVHPTKIKGIISMFKPVILTEVV